MHIQQPSPVRKDANLQLALFPASAALAKDAQLLVEASGTQQNIFSDDEIWPPRNALLQDARVSAIIRPR